jgi:glutamate carboxypeptidase
MSGLDAAERRLVQRVERLLDAETAFLERVVNVDSGTFHLEGVRAVGRLFAAELNACGFATRWIAMPESMNRAGHLAAERDGPGAGRPRLLLLGHLDTVQEGEGGGFRREGDAARGPGVCDMKGGDVAMLFALKALAECGLLDQATVRVFLTGDEENPGAPIALARRDLVAAAEQSDVGLSFEPDSGKAAIGRRGLSTWTLDVCASSGHSASALRAGGAGAVYEAARVLDGFRRLVAENPQVTINPGLLLAGTTVEHDPGRSDGAASGKFNVIAASAKATGDLRFVSPEEMASVQAGMRELAGRGLPSTNSRITFDDVVPGWPASDANRAVLSVIDGASRDLGYGPVAADDPATRGFGDFNFIGSLVAGADGLGVRGRGEHSPDEVMDLSSLLPSTARAAVVIARLLRDDAHGPIRSGR